MTDSPSTSVATAGHLSRRARLARVPAAFLRRGARFADASTAPSATPATPATSSPEQRSRLATSLLATVPIVLAATMAMSVLVAPSAEAAPSSRKAVKQRALATVKKAAPAVTGTAVAGPVSAAPSSYRVVAGDTVSSVATRYGLSTASVLALNGLGWKSLIYPGQTLKLSKATASAGAADAGVTKYRIVSGDTVTSIAQKHGLRPEAVLTANGLTATSVIFAGAQLTLPVAGTATSVRSAIDAETVASTTDAPTPTAGTTYELATGDTVTSVAEKFRVPVSAILTANGLHASSIVYAGRTLTIPSLTTLVGDETVTLLDDEMARNARTIIRVGRSMGVSDYGLVIALATAMQESGLRNIDFGHLDSVGLFQQRPSQGWGTVSTLTDPEAAARLFFGGVGEGEDGIPGLLDISGWTGMSVTKAAQAVQVSAYPDAYAQWETSARYWLRHLG